MAKKLAGLVICYAKTVGGGGVRRLNMCKCNKIAICSALKAFINGVSKRPHCRRRRATDKPGVRVFDYCNIDLFAYFQLAKNIFYHFCRSEMSTCQTKFLSRSIPYFYGIDDNCNS